MKSYISIMFILAVVVFLVHSVNSREATPSPCPVDMVQVGPICVDKYEASVWSSPAGGTQYGATTHNYPCSVNGNDCTHIFARTQAGVIPSRFITWFQAQQACANVGKRLLRNGEWQMAAAGTADPGTDNEATDCNISGPPKAVTPTGSRPNCVSNWGVFDMVGNADEWVEDWLQDNSDTDADNMSNALYGRDGIRGVDEAYPEVDRFPATPNRGGDFNDGDIAGVFLFDADHAPSGKNGATGFRCARDL